MIPGDIGAWAYGAAFAGALALSLGLTPIALRFAHRRSVLDHPGGYKRQSTAVPYLGGVAIVVSFCVAVALAALVGPAAGAVDALILILGLGLLLSVMGLIDDLRGLPPLPRLAIEVVAAFAIWLSGTGVSLFPFEPINAAVTILWIVGVTNAFNMLDNMDGLSAGVAAIAAGAFFVLAAINGQFLVASLAAALAGCALGFLRHNFHPARIYMGDAGSLFLGFLLSVIGLKLVYDDGGQATFFVPILVLGVALFDCSLVTLTRLRHGRNPMRGGRDHTSHRLVHVGIPVPVAVSLIYIAGATLGWLAAVMARADAITAIILMGLVTALGLILLVLLAAVPVYETSSRRHFMIQNADERSTRSHGTGSTNGDPVNAVTKHPAVTGKTSKAVRQRVLITGAAGFIGSHLLERYVHLGHDVIGLDAFVPNYDQAIKRRNLNEVRKTSQNVQFAELDLRDTSYAQRFLREIRPDVVIHLAGLAGVRPSVAQPALYTDHNVNATLSLLEAMRSTGCRKLIFGSSSSVYGAQARAPFTEDQAANRPVSPYAATKKACELFLNTYANLYEIDYIALRLFTVYGPRQRPDLAIHKFASAILKGEPISVNGDGLSSRDYTHVADIIDGITRATSLLTAKEGLMETINLGSSSPVLLRDLIAMIEQACDRQAILHHQPDQPGDVPRTYADISRANRLLSYKPNRELMQGIEDFVTWLRAQHTDSSTAHDTFRPALPHT